MTPNNYRTPCSTCKLPTCICKWTAQLRNTIEDIISVAQNSEAKLQYEKKNTEDLEADRTRLYHLLKTKGDTIALLNNKIKELNDTIEALTSDRVSWSEITGAAERASKLVVWDGKSWSELIHILCNTVEDYINNASPNKSIDNTDRNHDDLLAPCGHSEPQADSQLHGVCVFCWRDRAARLRDDVERLTRERNAFCERGAAVENERDELREEVDRLTKESKQRDGAVEHCRKLMDRWTEEHENGGCEYRKKMNDAEAQVAALVGVLRSHEERLARSHTTPIPPPPPSFPLRRQIHSTEWGETTGDQCPVCNIRRVLSDLTTAARERDRRRDEETVAKCVVAVKVRAAAIRTARAAGPALSRIIAQMSQADAIAMTLATLDGIERDLRAVLGEEPQR